MAKIKRALISVSDKKGIIEFAKELKHLGIEIISTGGTASLLKENKIKATDVSDYTGFPEMMNGRLKTLHPKIHGGILALREKKEHMENAKKHKIELIDMVVVNLYPFQKTVSKGRASLKEAIENIDIGGPTMLRSAAKNYEHVAVIVDTKEYSSIIKELKQNRNNLSKETLRHLAVKAFKHTGSYDTIIGDYLCQCYGRKRFPETLNFTFEKIQELRYGENPHQRGAFYREPFIHEACIATAKQLWGKELSYNNIMDADAGFELVKEFNEPTAAIIKHANPCGVASRKTISEAFKTAYNVDPMSAFGCIIALNKKCDLETAKLTKDKFIEVIVAPSYDKSALEYLKENKKNLRILETGPITRSNLGYDMKKVIGGLLVQTRNWPNIENVKLKAVTKRKPTKKELDDLMFCWKVNKHVKSNSVVFAKNKVAYGIGAGQMSRVDSSIIAARKSAGRAKGGVMSSDAFFPFRDAVDAAAKAGIKAVIQPGGSIRDEEVIKAADEHGMSMVFSGVRLFKH